MSQIMATSPKERILVIDDEPGMREMLARTLTERGYVVATADDGIQAIEMIRADRFQLAICDINMPKLTGLQVLEAVREIDPDIEVIMMTGFATVDTAVEAMKKGAYDFIQKPFMLDEFFELVEKSLERRHLRLSVAVYEASRLVFRSVKLETLLPTIANLSLKILNADEVSVMTMDDNGRLRLTGSAGRDPSQRGSACVCIGEIVAARVAEGREPLLITDAAEFRKLAPEVAGACDVKSSIVYPLLVDDQVLGVISFNRIAEGKPLTKADLRIATIFASQIGQAIYNAYLYRRLEERQSQLVQSEKMASLGLLAAGVAHELNNPLSGIMGFAQLLLEDARLTPEQKQDIRTINEESIRCRDIIRNLLQFSRAKNMPTEPVDLAALIKTTIELFRYDLSTGGVKTVQDLPPALARIRGNSNQLQQVFVNLVSNALQAMEHADQPALKIRATEKGGRVFIRFEDNGVGIPKRALGRIFDPFFTTKPVGKGTGLGLSICYGIVHRHGGDLRVESESGKGAAFTVELPVVQEANA